MNIFLELLNVWLSFSNNPLPTFCHIDEILDQFIFEIHLSNWPLILINRIFIVSHPKILHLNLP